MVIGKKFYFRLGDINEFYGLDDNVIEHAIFKKPMQQDKKDALEKIAWSGIKWDRTPNGEVLILPA